MTKKKSVVTLIATGVMLVVWLVLTSLTAQHQLGALHKEPTAGCEQDAAQYPGTRPLRPQGDVQTSPQNQNGQKQSGQQRVEVNAPLEAACRANAIAAAGLNLNGIALIVAASGVCLAALAVIVPSLLAEYGAAAFRRRHAALTIDAAYRADDKRPGWLVHNTGQGTGFVQGVSVSASPPGVATANLIAAMVFGGNGFEIASGGRREFDWTGLVPAGDCLIAIRFSDTAGNRGVSWARFKLTGSPAHHQKHEEGCAIED